MTKQQTIDQHVTELHRRAFVIDGHSDILIPVAESKMDLGDRPDLNRLQRLG